LPLTLGSRPFFFVAVPSFADPTPPLKLGLGAENAEELGVDTVGDVEREEADMTKEAVEESRSLEGTLDWVGGCEYG
jgi:hypothetical protein